MEGTAFLSDPAMDAGTPDSLQPDARRWRIILASAFARFGCAAVLLIAASLKAYQLFTDPALGVLYGSRWLQGGLVEYELLLSFLLISGDALRWGRRIALITFLGFGGYAFFLGISGEESCRCFGNAHVSPWWSFSIDALLVSFLFVWKPQRAKHNFDPGTRNIHFASRMFLAVSVATAVIGVPTLIALGQIRSDSSLEYALAHNRFVLLEPEKWLGKPFPLTDYIDIAERERLSHGSWLLVFYHHDCPKCQRALARYERLAEQRKSVNAQTKLALIAVPPYAPAPLAANPLFHQGRLKDNKEWLITTPAEVRLTDGQVTAAELDAEFINADAEAR